MVFTFAWDDEDGQRGHETLVALDFVDRDGKTRMTLRQTTFQSVAVRDDHSGGWNSALDRLEEAVAAL